MGLSPQCQTVLNHLTKAGSITPGEAAMVHQIRHLPRRILDLKEAGYKISRKLCKDVNGQRYARYTLEQPE